MKKIVLCFILSLIIVVSLGCNKQKTESINPILPTESITKEPSVEGSNQPTIEPTVKPTIEPTPEPTVEPTPAIVTDINAQKGMAIDIVNNMTLEEKIGQIFLVNFESLDPSKGSYYEFREITDQMIQNLEKYNIGGVVFFSRNIETREQTMKFIQELQKNSRIPLYISVDEEGGEVARIANNKNMQTTKFPTMAEIGAMDDTEYTYNMGSTIGKEIKKLGFNLNFAPVADVKTNEHNTEIGNRSFGDNAKLVSRMVKQMVLGLQDQNVSATLKHFPGHGNASEDTHDGAVSIDNDLNRLRSVDFVPFKAGIKAGADFIMVSHLSISRVTENTIPASLSNLVMDTILRTEMAFNGIIITDAMDMKSITDHYTSAQAAVLAIEAGADIVLMPENFEEAYMAVYHAVQEEKISIDRIDNSVRRIIEKKIQRGMILQDTELLKERVFPTKAPEFKNQNEENKEETTKQLELEKEQENDKQEQSDKEQKDEIK